MATNVTRSFLTFVAVIGSAGRRLGFLTDGTLTLQDGTPIEGQLATDTVRGLLDGSVPAMSLHKAVAYAGRHNVPISGTGTIRGLAKSSASQDFLSFVVENASAKGVSRKEAKVLVAAIRGRYQ